MENIIIEIMDKFGYLGICLLILIENLFPPIPSEIILTFGGFMTHDTKMTIIGVIIIATIGSLLGAIILYYIGKILNKERLIKIVTSKYGKLLRVKPKDIESAENWFLKKGNITVLFCRCIPVVRSLISIPAGMSKMKLGKFIIYTTIGSAVWNTLLVLIGAFAGEKKDLIINIIDKLSDFILIGLIFGFIIFVIVFYSKRGKNQKNNN